MQLQVECDRPSVVQPCLICAEPVAMAAARIILCDDQGHGVGEVCTTCLENGFDWLSAQFEQLSKPKKPAIARQPRHLEMPISA
ncbi:hypothetical protein ACQ4M4_05635 [Leptolyngbya sp. AN02str]|uniref:hypothetical protein n=1 Tax=Leptolyngbya sp. AN02str TaxID=3423363 RepID=UPI003D321C5A